MEYDNNFYAGEGGGVSRVKSATTLGKSLEFFTVLFSGCVKLTCLQTELVESWGMVLKKLLQNVHAFLFL